MWMRSDGGYWAYVLSLGWSTVFIAMKSHCLFGMGNCRSMHGRITGHFAMGMRRIVYFDSGSPAITMKW